MKENTDNPYDIIGIGFGPSNIALAITLQEEHPDLRSLFIEKNEASNWQTGLLLGNSDIQNHPLRDLATPRNPKSHYSFTNYLFEQGRLFEHLNMGLYYPYRYEYRDYIKWASQHFDDIVKYSTMVESIVLPSDTSQQLFNIKTSTGERYSCKNLIIGTGRTPYIPSPLTEVAQDKLIHGVNFNKIINKLDEGDIQRVAVVGGSQSAIEIILYLASHYPNLKIHGISRKFGYRLKDSSPFTGEVYFPEFVDLFYNSKTEHKNRFKNDLNLTNYSASDSDVLDELYRVIYKEKHFGNSRIKIHNSVDIKHVSSIPQGTSIELVNAYGNEAKTLVTVDLIVSATGFRDTGPAEHQESCPPVLKPIYSNLTKDDGDMLSVSRNYRLSLNQYPDLGLYLNGICESSHGMGDAGSISLVSLRAKNIMQSIAG